MFNSVLCIFTVLKRVNNKENIITCGHLIHLMDTIRFECIRKSVLKKYIRFVSNIAIGFFVLNCIRAVLFSLSLVYVFIATLIGM